MSSTKSFSLLALIAIAFAVLAFAQDNTTPGPGPMTLEACLDKYGELHCIGHIMTLDGGYQWLTPQQCMKQYGNSYCAGEYWYEKP